MKSHSVLEHRPKHGDVIACLLSFGNDHAIEAKISEGLNTATEERGYSPLNGVIPIDPRTEVKRLVKILGDKIAGIAIQPFRPNRELAELLLTPPVRDIPHIMIGHYYSNLQISACVIDNYGGMYAITEHLLRLGRRRFAFFGEVSLSSTEHERFQGFAEACLHNGIQVKPDRIVKSYVENDLRNMIHAMLQSAEPPDALVCLFDGLASSVLRILTDYGIRVPERISVVSFGDDEDIADKCSPPLSTAYHPAFEMGAVAAHQLINQIEGKIPPTSSIFVLPVGVHVRESCGAVQSFLPEGGSFWEVPFSGYIGVKTTLTDARR
jgi:LacI family transcriptional regulator